MYTGSGLRLAAGFRFQSLAEALIPETVAFGDGMVGIKTEWGSAWREFGESASRALV